MSAETRTGAANRQWWRGFFVERGFQGRQVRRLLGLSIASGLVAAAVLYGFYNRIIEELASGELPVYFAPEQMAEIDAGMAGLRETLLYGIAGLIVLNLLITLVVGAIITRKLGGPLFRFRAAMTRIADGDLTVDVKLREGDEFQDLSDNINEAVARLQVVVLSVRDHVRVLSEMDPEAPDPEALQRAVEGLRSAVDYFHTVTPDDRDGRAVT